MPYSLKHQPECYPRPESIKTNRWFIALAVMIAVSVIIMRIFGRYVDTQHFWLFAVGVPVAIWATAFAFRLGVWMLRDMKANGFDRRREQWILRETRRARRALQILNTTFITAFPEAEQIDVASMMQDNQSIIASQSDWNGNDSQRMSRISVEPEDTPPSLTSRLFTDLIAALPISLFPEKASLHVALDCSLPAGDVRKLWEDAWDESGITCPVEYVSGHGAGVIDHWLDHHIKESAMLLVVSLQVAPEDPHNTAEAAVAVLLGNRLTQEALKPIALLHRPDPSPPGQLEDGMRMAAYNVPIKDNIVKTLWLAGLSSDQRAEVVENQNKYPAQSVEGEAVANLDVSMGHAGAAAPWLAIAAATEIARQTQLPQMIISGDTTQDVLWSTLVTPIASRQEMAT